MFRQNSQLFLFSYSSMRNPIYFYIEPRRNCAPVKVRLGKYESGSFPDFGHKMRSAFLANYSYSQGECVATASYGHNRPHSLTRENEIHFEKVGRGKSLSQIENSPFPRHLKKLRLQVEKLRAFHGFTGQALMLRGKLL